MCSVSFRLSLSLYQPIIVSDCTTLLIYLQTFCIKHLSFSVNSFEPYPKYFPLFFLIVATIEIAKTTYGSDMSW